MFTSEPSLIQRIERMILETPIIDIDTELQPGRLSAPDLFGLLGEPSLRAELLAVGMNPGDLDPSVPDADRIRKVVPLLARVRNTAAAWCFYRILRDLHDFYDPNLTEENAPELIAKVARTGDDPTWGPTLLRDRCNIRLASARFEGQQEPPLGEAPQFFGILDLDSLLVGSNPNEPIGSRLARVLGESPASESQLKSLFFAWLDRETAGPGGRVASLSLPAVSALPSQASEASFSGGDAASIIRSATRNILAWHDERAKTLRIVIGTGHGFDRLAPDWVETLAATLNGFGKARFDLVAGTDSARDGACRLAARLSQVYVSASWRGNYSAASIADFIARQVHQVPMAKVTGFASGASTAEWVYGKQQMARKAIASGFARLVEGGYYEEDEVRPILRSLLHDTPSQLYARS